MNKFTKYVSLFLVLLITGCWKEENKTYRVFEDGYELYFNPVTGEECYMDEVVSKGKNGCMKWYAFNDSKTSKKVQLLLSHNTTSIVEWNKDNGNDPDTVLKQLKEDTKDWKKEIRNTARLIKVKEITKILGLKDLDNEFGLKYHIHSYDENDIISEEGYVWLFDNTSNCLNYGCTEEDYSTYGYWTDTLSSSRYGTAWVISGNAMLSQYYVKYADLYGVRPVIKVDKSEF